MKADLKVLSKTLQENPKAGIALSQNLYKIRLANTPVPTGESGGFRTIYYYLCSEEKLFLLTIYSKTQRKSITEKELLELLKLNGWLPL